MRLAFSYLIDRQTIVDNIGQCGPGGLLHHSFRAKMSDGNGGEFKVRMMLIIHML
jgi:hypothetical protein